MHEEAVVFGSEGSLVGVVTAPEASVVFTRSPAVLLLNAGLLHRVGPNRLYVNLARRLAALGFLVLRFDFSGIGDSPATRSSVPFDQRALAEAHAAADFLKGSFGVRKYLPLGLCAGAEVALGLAASDPRAVGAILVNGRMGTEPDAALRRAAQERLQARYYRSRLWDPTRWMRLLRGRSNLQGVSRFVSRTLGRLVRRRRDADPPDAASQVAAPALSHLDRLAERGAELLVVFSAGSFSLTLCQLIFGDQLAAISSYPKVKLAHIEDCDHVFTPLWAQDRLVDLIATWTVTATTATGHSDHYQPPEPVSDG
jgi:pimeloyl-ACP methyl ester carboxylesterase